MAGTDVDKIIKTLQDLELDDESDCYVYLVVENNQIHKTRITYFHILEGAI
jgi:hypothetical protein